MSNIIITFEANIIDIEFNDFAKEATRKESVQLKSKVEEISIRPNGEVNLFFESRGRSFSLSSAKQPILGTLLVDSIGGVVPKNNDHLYALLISNIF